MIKLFVGDDLAEAEKFYGAAFGAKKVGSVGDGVDIVTFPDGGPGVLLIKSKADDEKYGAMIVQVPDLDVGEARRPARTARRSKGRSGEVPEAWRRSPSTSSTRGATRSRSCSSADPGRTSWNLPVSKSSSHQFTAIET